MVGLGVGSFVLAVFFAAFEVHRFLNLAILALYSCIDFPLAANDKKMNRPMKHAQMSSVNAVFERNAKNSLIFFETLAF